jgi:hypothetical protein
MHLLHRALDDDGELRDIVGRLSRSIAENALKHAIVLDLNPFWLACYRLAEAGLSEDLLPDYYSGRLPYPLGSVGGGGGFVDLSRKISGFIRPTIDMFGDRKDPASPYLLRIFARPTPDGGEWTSYRQQLVNAARETPIATIVETQEPARLITAPGDLVTSSTGLVGTLGGFLLDKISGTTFAVTCGHVIAGGTAAFLGPCVHAKAPIALPPAVPCTSSCGWMTELDVALIDVRGATATNVATSIAAIVAPGDIVNMNGAKSGSLNYEIGGAVVEHSIGGACWDRLFLFHAPVSVGLLAVPVRVALTPTPRGGDSGSWLLRNTSEWVGMVVAANALHGYALAGTSMLARSDSAFGTQLQLA